MLANILLAIFVGIPAVGLAIHALTSKDHGHVLAKVMFVPSAILIVIYILSGVHGTTSYKSYDSNYSASKKSNGKCQYINSYKRNVNGTGYIETVSGHWKYCK